MSERRSGHSRLVVKHGEITREDSHPEGDMMVYVVTAEPYHDNSSVLGAYSSMEVAKAAHPAEWNDEGFYVEWPGVVAYAVEGDDKELRVIYALVVDAKDKAP